MSDFILRFISALQLLVLFTKEVAISSVKVSWWVYSQGSKLDSKFIHLPLTVKQPWQQILIAHFITLTPGTMSVEIEKNKSILVHVLKSSEVDETVSLVRDKVEPLVKRIWGQK